MNDKIILGIAGGTGSGKTSVAQIILEDLKKFGCDIVVLEQDAYYAKKDNLSLEERKKLNYDHPSIIDFDLLISHVNDLKNGKSIEKPNYDFTNHIRMDKTTTLMPQDIIIVEGILIFVEEKLRDLFDMKIFVDTDDDIRLLRRIERDIKERGRTLEDIKKQYITTVKPMHNEFVEPSKKYADVIIPRGKENLVAIKMVTSRLKYLLNKSRGKK